MDTLTDVEYRKVIIEDKYLYVFDNLIEKKIIDNFFDNAIALDYSRKEKTHARDNSPIFSVDLDPVVFEEKTVVGTTARKLLNRFADGDNYSLERSYINMCHFGDIEYPHRDCAIHETDLTVLYYINKEWKHTWGGETIFYENADTRFAVLPKPGRFALFNGAIEHIGSIPTRICLQSRLTLALKYKQK